MGIKNHSQNIPNDEISKTLRIKFWVLVTNMGISRKSNCKQKVNAVKIPHLIVDNSGKTKNKKKIPVLLFQPARISTAH